MPMQWNAEAMQQLYLAILKTSDGLKYDANEIAKYMGPDCTAKAVVHRLTTVKSEVKALAEGWDGVTAPDVSSTNPKKRKRSTAHEDGDNGGHANETKATKTSKARKTPAAKKARAKVDTPVKEDPVSTKEEEDATSVKEETEAVKEESVKKENVKKEKVKSPK